MISKQLKCTFGIFIVMNGLNNKIEEKRMRLSAGRGQGKGRGHNLIVL